VRLHGHLPPSPGPDGRPGSCSRTYKTLANPRGHPGPAEYLSCGGWDRGLTKAGEGSLVGTEAHPVEDGLAGGALALEWRTEVQGSASVQSLEISPGMGGREATTSGSNAHPLRFPWASLWPDSQPSAGKLRAQEP
jgi:hypothetical protein